MLDLFAGRAGTGSARVARHLHHRAGDPAIGRHRSPQRALAANPAQGNVSQIRQSDHEATLNPAQRVGNFSARALCTGAEEGTSGLTWRCRRVTTARPMNFIEAAIKILKESRKAMSAEELTDLAVERKLLSKPGKNPLRSMKTALSKELNLGEDGRVSQSADERWKLKRSAPEAQAKASKTSKAAKKAVTSKTASKKTAASTASKATSKTAPKKAAASKKPAEAKKAEGETRAQPRAAATTAKTAASSKKKGKKAAAPAEKAAAPEVKPEVKNEVKPEAKNEAKSEAKNDTAVATKPARSKPSRAAARRAQARQKARAAAETVPATDTSVGDVEAEAASSAQPVQIELLDQTAVAAEAELHEPPSPELDELIAPKQQVRRGAAPETPEDSDLEAIYGDELSGTEPGAAFAEYRDAQTEDEDRPMTPELVSSRRDRMRRSQRNKRSMERQERQERRERDRDARRDSASATHARPGRPEQAQPAAGAAAGAARTDRPAAGRPPRAERAPRPDAAPVAESAPALAARAVEPAPAPMAARSEVDDFYRPGNVLGDAVAEIMRGFRNDQPAPVKQLAQMMRKRELLDDDQGHAWLHLKAALLSDEQGYRDHGLRPRVVYRGRDQFGPGPAAATPALASAEAALVDAVTHLTRVTHQALQARLSELSTQALERLAHVYLLRNGWQNLQWIKRVERSSYAVGDAPGGVGQVLVGVRAGSDAVDRRGVGELRAGVAYKNLDSGLLLAPQDLSEAARKELSRGGRSVAALVGDAFVAALMRCGIGVLAKSVPVSYLDDGLFAELDAP